LKASFKERDKRRYCRRRSEVKAVGISADESARFVRRGFQKTRGTPMIRIQRTKDALSRRG
jgi:hypothetical protein